MKIFKIMLNVILLILITLNFSFVQAKDHMSDKAFCEKTSMGGGKYAQYIQGVLVLTIASNIYDTHIDGAYGDFVAVRIRLSDQIGAEHAYVFPYSISNESESRDAFDILKTAYITGIPINVCISKVGEKIIGANYR